MKNPTFNDFVRRVGGAFLLFIVVIQFTKSYAPEYTGGAVIVVAILCFAYAAYSESKAKKRAKAKKQKRKRH